MRANCGVTIQPMAERVAFAMIPKICTPERVEYITRSTRF